MDRLLLSLWDALFLNQAQKWTNAGDDNLTADEALELGRWFLRGQTVGIKPIFEGICAMCGALLHGTVGQNSALSNRRVGAPIDRDGALVVDGHGQPDVEAQPPFLYRFSPSVFADEAPEVFQYDPETNALSLRDGVPEPWIHVSRAGKQWQYCNDCETCWLSTTRNRTRKHIPFRDKASQHWMRPVARNERTGAEPATGLASSSSRASLAEPEAEDDLEEPQLRLEDEPVDENIDEVPVDIPELTERRRPTLEEYAAKWDALKEFYSRPVPGSFSRNNLVPRPNPQLWQDCPYVPFAKLKSSDAQARLSVCRPHSSLEEASCCNGVPRYAHITGDVRYWRRAPLQLSSTMGFVLNEQSGHFMRLIPDETDALHEILTWGRQHGNNRILSFFGTAFENFHGACRKMMDRFRSVLPEGSRRARIRMSRRESREPTEGTLDETLGEEACGMVIVDASGHPMKYDALKILEGAVGTQNVRLEIDVAPTEGRGWRRTNSSIDTQHDAVLNEQWRRDISSGATHLLQETWVPANDPHLDAKVWPHVHPYGTGSLLSEVGSGGEQHHARNRLTLIQSWFRRSSAWGFWFLTRLHQTELFFKNRRRRESDRNGASPLDSADPITRLFGTAMPSDIPESTGWWQRQTRDLLALSDDAEMGLMQAMVTLTANDSSPEMLACVRRGPLASPTDEERIEYLLARKRRDQERPPTEHYSLEHVLSFQRRVHAFKQYFLRRGHVTPLGKPQDFWDRTEAQMRGALHSHILVWFQRRKIDEGYKPIPAVKRTVQGTQQRQRPRAHTVEEIDPYQEDDIYHKVHAGRIVTEMVRPSVAGSNYGGFDYEMLRVAGLARHIQTRLYLHRCSPQYCLKGRSACRFFFPWPRQPQQQYDDNTERVACQRRLEDDDQWLNPHNLYLAMFSPSTAHVLPFCPRNGADSARQYACKYAGKPEKWYFLDGDRSGVKEFLKCRTVGLCMTHNRLLNFHVVRSTKPLQYTAGEFVPPRGSRTPRDAKHKQMHPQYPDTRFYLSHFGKYLFRNESLRHLRVEQFNRFFAFAGDSEVAVGPTLEDTLADEDDEVPPVPEHRHYDAFAQEVGPGIIFSSTISGVPGVRRRKPARLAVTRNPFLEPIGARREAFYEQRLLLGLAWYCPEPPIVAEDGVQHWRFVWHSPTEADVGVELPALEFSLGDTPISFEQLCSEFEDELCKGDYNLICDCCALRLKEVCAACQYAVGFHCCQNPENSHHHLMRWRKGTLFAGAFDAERCLLNLYRKGLPMEKLKKKAQEYVEGGLLSDDAGKLVCKTLENEKRVERIVNAHLVDGAQAPSEGVGDVGVSSTLSAAGLRKELEVRELRMREGAAEGGTTDQWRVYEHITEKLATGEPLRLMVQASAGTGTLSPSVLVLYVYIYIYIYTYVCSFQTCKQRRSVTYTLS